MTPHPAEPQQHDAVQSDLWRRVNAEAARDEWKRALSPWDGGSLVVRDDSLGRRLDGRSSVLMPRSPKLGSGPIAGIIVGCVVALGLLVCVLVPFILRLTRGRRSASPVVDTEANDPQTAPPAFGPRKDSERRLSQHDFVLPVTGLRKEDLPARQATKQSSFGQPEAGRDGTVAHAGPPVTGPTSAEAIYGGLIVASPVPAAASLPGPPSVPTMAGSQSPQKAAFSPTAQDGSGDVEMKDLAKASGAGSSAAVKAEAAAPGEAVSAGHLEAPSATGSDHGRPALNASYYDPTSSLYASAVDLSMSGPPPAPVELDQFKRKGISRVFSSSSRSPVKRSTGDSSGSNWGITREDSFASRLIRKLTGKKSSQSSASDAQPRFAFSPAVVHDEPGEMDEEEMAAGPLRQPPSAGGAPGAPPGAGPTRGLPPSAPQPQSTLPPPPEELKRAAQPPSRTFSAMDDISTPTDTEQHIGILPPSQPQAPFFVTPTADESSATVNPMDIMKPSTSVENNWHVNQELLRIESAAATAAAGISPPNPIFVLPDPELDADPSSPETNGGLEPGEPTDYPTPGGLYTDMSAHPTPDSRLDVDDASSMRSLSEVEDTPMNGVNGGPSTAPTYLEPGPSNATPSPTPSRGYVCSECNRTFDQIHKLNHHKRYHDRPHECPHPGCDKRFGTKTHLDRHINDKHMKTRKYYCIDPTCAYSRRGGKSFPRKDNWRRHMINKHALNPASDPEPDVDEVMGGL